MKQRKPWMLIGFAGACLAGALSVKSVLAESPSVGEGPADAAVAVELRRSTQALLDAIAPGDASVWDRFLDSRFIQVDENDTVRNKAQVLAELKPLGAGLTGHLEIAEFRMARRGDTAVATHEDSEYLDYHGQIIRSRFRMTDTWIRIASQWRLLGSQVLAVLQDPPAVSLDPETLCAYEGRYELTAEITGVVRCGTNELTFEREGRPLRRFLAESPDQFFEPGEPRTRRLFQRDASGRVASFVDRREARDILWRRVGAPPSP